MSVAKRNGSWYICGKIKKCNGTCCSYTRKAKGAKTKKDAQMFESHFLKQYQEQSAYAYKITFKALCGEFLDNNVDLSKLLFERREMY